VMGGLGPTPDDVTGEAIAELTGRPLVPDDSALRRIEARFRNAGRPVTPLARRQALVPEGAVIFENRVGLAPGSALEHEGSVILLLPGVPIELRQLLGEVRPWLAERYKLQPPAQQRVRTFGLPEAAVASRLMRIGRSHPDVRFAFYPGESGVDVVIRFDSRRGLRPIVGEVVDRLGDAVYEVGERSVEQILGEALGHRRITVCVAESCTGGLIGSRVTDVPGSSDYFRGSIAAYSNDVKMEQLEVSPSTLDRFGAVSSQCVREMAKGVRRRLRADVAIAVSWVAGPGGGTADKPVGLVYAASAGFGKTKVKRFRFTGDRSRIKECAATGAMLQCVRLVEEAK